jgi:hypothetical protein
MDTLINFICTCFDIFINDPISYFARSSVAQLSQLHGNTVST